MADERTNSDTDGTGEVCDVEGAGTAWTVMKDGAGDFDQWQLVLHTTASSLRWPVEFMKGYGEHKR